MSLSRDAILTVVDVQIEKVVVPEWGGDVFLRGLTGEERDAWEASRRQIRGAGTKHMEIVPVSDNARASLLVKCIIDEAGERVFTDRDAPALGTKNGKIIDRLYDVAAALSGIGGDDEEELAGNSEAPTASGASASSSPETSSTAP
jgi:hypothetical protein